MGLAVIVQEGFLQKETFLYELVCNVLQKHTNSLEHIQLAQFGSV